MTQRPPTHDVDGHASSPRERADALKLLMLFRDRMVPSDGSLETLIYKASPKLGMIVKRTTIFHWFTGRNGISPKMYPAIRAFIQSKLFQQRVPEALTFASNALLRVLEVGQLMASRGYTNAPQQDRRAALARLHGYHRMKWPDAYVVGGMAGIVRFEYVHGYDFAVIAALDQQRMATYAGYVFHRVAHEDARMSFQNFPVPGGVRDVFVVDAIELSNRRKVLQEFQHAYDMSSIYGEGPGQDSSAPFARWEGTKWGTEHGPPIISMSGPLPIGGANQLQEKVVLDKIIWDVAAHGIAKP